MLGISAPKFESRTASPTMPGMAISSIADAQSGAGIRRQRSRKMQIAEVTSGVRAKLIQYRIAVVSKTSGPCFWYQSVHATQNTSPNPKNRATSRPRT